MAKRRTNVMNRRAPQAVLAAVFALTIISAAFWAGAGHEFVITGYVPDPPSGQIAKMTPFFVDAAASTLESWVSCGTAVMTQQALDDFCRCKGYGAAKNCWFVNGVGRYAFGGRADPPTCMAQGVNKGYGYGLVYVACENTCGGLISATTPVVAPAFSYFQAVFSGLGSQCGTKTVYIKENDCNGITNCSTSPSIMGGGMCNADTPRLGGTYKYAACIDINGDNDFLDYGENASITVQVHSLCGNGVAETDVVTEVSELCDKNDVRGETCSDAGDFTGGTLKCNATCDGYDTLLCTSPAPPPAPSWCGDGKVNSTESCDGKNFTGKSCVSLGYTGGNLTCSADCKTIVTSSCAMAPTAVCGNSKIETGEECDGTKFGGDSCLAEGFTGGSLTCTDDCTIDTSTCSNYECGNSKIEPGEDCDGTKLGGKTCKNLGEGFTGGTLACSDDCTFDTSDCIETPAVTAADALVAINDAQNAITNATNAKKNMTIAIAKFNSAVTAYNTGDYEQSKADALAAKLDVTIAPPLEQPGGAIDFTSILIIAAIIGAVAAAFYILKVKRLKLGIETGPKTPNTQSPEAR